MPRGAAGVDAAGPDHPPGTALVVGERLPEAVPVGADQGPEAAVPELDQGRLDGAVMVPVPAQVDEVALVPSAAGVIGVEGHEGVARGFPQESHHRHHHPAGAGLHDVHQGAAPVPGEELGIDPGLPLVQAAHRPDLVEDAGVRFVGLVVPAPFPLPGVHEHQHQDTPARLLQDPPFPVHCGIAYLEHGALAVPGTSLVAGKVGFVAFDRQETAVVQQHEGPVTVGDQLSGLGVSPFGSRRRSRGPCGEARRPETQPDQDGESHRHGAHPHEPDQALTPRKFGWGTGIRTPITWSRATRVAVTPSPNRSAERSAL